MNNWYKTIKDENIINFLKLINKDPYEFLNNIDKYANNQEVWNALKKLAKNKYIARNCLEKIIYFIDKDDAFKFLLSYKNEYPDLFNKLSKYFVGHDKNVFNYIDKVDEKFISIIPKIRNYKRAIQFLKKFEEYDNEKLSENLDLIIKNINENSSINVYLNDIFDSLYSNNDDFINKKYIFENFSKLPQTYKLKKYIFDNFLEKIDNNLNEFINFILKYGGLYCQNDTVLEQNTLKNIINKYNDELLEEIKKLPEENVVNILEYLNLFGSINFLSKNLGCFIEKFGNNFYFQKFLENCLRNELLEQIGINFKFILDINNIDLINNCLYEFKINNKYEYIIDNIDRINKILPNFYNEINKIPGIEKLFEFDNFQKNIIQKTKLIENLNNENLENDILSVYKIFNPFFKNFYTRDRTILIGNKRCLKEINNVLYNEIYDKNNLYTVIENNKKELLPNSYEKFIHIVNKYGNNINKIKEKFNNEMNSIWGQIMLPLYITYSSKSDIIKEKTQNIFVISLCIPIEFCIELSKYIHSIDIEDILGDIEEFSYENVIYSPIVDVCFIYDYNKYSFVLTGIENRLKTLTKSGLDFKNEIDSISFNTIKDILIKNNSESLKLYVVVDDEEINNEKINYRMMIRKFNKNKINPSEYSKLCKIILEIYAKMEYKYFIIKDDKSIEISENEYKKHISNNTIVINSLLKLFAIEKNININSYTKLEIFEKLYELKKNDIIKNTKVVIKEKLINKTLFKSIVEKNKENIKLEYFSNIIEMINKYNSNASLIDWNKYNTKKWGYIQNELPPISLNGFNKELVEFIIMTPLYEE